MAAYTISREAPAASIELITLISLQSQTTWPLLQWVQLLPRRLSTTTCFQRAVQMMENTMETAGRRVEAGTTIQLEHFRMCFKSISTPRAPFVR